MTNHCLSGICGVFLIPILGCTDLVVIDIDTVTGLTLLPERPPKNGDGSPFCSRICSHSNPFLVTTPE